MVLHEFDDMHDMRGRAAAVLGEHLCLSPAALHAVLLPGGRTPLPVYAAVAADPPRVDEHLHVLLSDERHVPLDDGRSNYGGMRRFLDALGVPDGRRLRVDTALSPAPAAAAYDERIAWFFAAGGRITLALLGLGADGHTASLFGEADLQSAGERYAIAVSGPDGMNRVTAAPAVLRAAERIVFLAAGPEKAAVVRKLIEHPADVIAGMAVAGGVEPDVWYCPEAPGAHE